MKLSKAQIRVLERLAAGERLHFIGGLNARYFFHATERALNFLTMCVLEKYGFIEPCDVPDRTGMFHSHPNYQLSAKGRAFMKGWEPTP